MKKLFHPQTHNFITPLDVFLIEEWNNRELWWMKIINLYKNKIEEPLSTRSSFFWKANTFYLFILIQNRCIFSFIKKHRGVMRCSLLGSIMQMFCISEWQGECFNSKINLYFIHHYSKQLLGCCLVAYNNNFFFFLNNTYQKYNYN